MKVKAMMTVGCLCLVLGLCAATTWARNPIKTVPGPVVDRQKIPKIVRLPDLTITRIYHKKHGGKEGVWADIKNIGGPISKDQFDQATMRFYLNYLNISNPATGPVIKQGNNGYALNYLDRSGVLRKPGGTISAVAPGDLVCEGVVQVTVRVDIPLAGHGRIKESNEQNNERTATLRCP